MSGSGFFGNNNATTTGFGGGGGGAGFGSGNTGFGTSNNASNPTSIFGGANNTTAASGGFGSTGFGASNTTFGAAKPTTGFGAPATTGGSAFGGNATAAPTGFGGFGTANNAASTGFGAAANTGGGGMFGGGKLATGFGATTGNNMFGGGAATTGFGASNTAASSNPFASNTNTGFGASNAATTNNNTGFGANNAVGSNTGTGSVPFQAWTEREPTGSMTSHYQSITFQEPYKNKSFEELRVEDYLQGRKVGNPNGQAGTFGASTGFGGSTFGNNNTPAAPATGGLFGSGNNASTSTTSAFGGFGANNNNNTASTGAFGSNTTGGGLFGAAKPASTGGLFGTSTSQPSTGFGNTAATTGGGLFGGGNTSGFGGANNNNTTNTSGGGLFGNNTAQSKPAFGGFGTGATNNSTGFGTGNTGSTGGGLFGSTNNSTTTGGGGLFGNNAQSQPASNPFGGSTNSASGGGLFGAGKPATSGGLFGSTNTTGGNTGGGLFGNNAGQTNNSQPQQGSGLFGSSTTNNTGGGGLFGSSTQAKPAGGLFGSSTTAATGGGGLFGSGGNNSAQPAGNSLFGNSNAGGSLFGNTQNKPATGGLFGGTAANGNASNSLFGSNNNQPAQQNNGGSLFGSSIQNTQNNNNNSMFGSSFGQSNNNNNNSQSQLHANLTISPYGNDQLFSSLASASTPVGPLATPLAGARPTPSKTQSLLSSTRLNSPIYTPRASAVGRNPGYGFSYSTYGTPGSAYSVSVTPQAGSLLKPTSSLGSALTSRLAKSMSMNNLRGGDSTPREGESLLRPTPGSASSRYLNSGNMRKLTIDRSLRTDFFSPPTEQRQPEHRQLEAARDTDNPSLGKKVSFDENTRSSNAEATADNALVRTEEPEEDRTPRTMYRASEKTPANGTPEMQQINGGSLHTVFEDGEPRRPASAPGHRQAEDDVPKEVDIGDYWTKPSIKDLKNMGRETLKKLGGLTVGRAGVGRIEFSACDLSNTELDDICGHDNGKGIVHLKPRSATVYPNEATKPARGKGLNVPSKIFLDNSWPKSHGGKKVIMANSGPAYDKHVRRLKKTGGTQFIDYDSQTGTWSFSVEHFTTYELDDSDDNELTVDVDGQQDSSGLSDAPATPGQEDDTVQSIETGGTGTGEVDDTFEFKINQRSLSSIAGARVPGGFDESHISYDYDDPSADEDVNEDLLMSGGLGNAEEDPFASPGGAVHAPSPRAYERFHSSMLDEHAGAVQLAEEMQIVPEPELPGSFMPEEPKLLRSILKPSGRASAFASPQKLATETWEDQLQRTMSPKKRDRQYLREIQQSARVLHEPQEDFIGTPFKRSMLGRSALGQSYLAQKSAKKAGSGNSTMQVEPAGWGKSQAFRTSMDIMNSLWSQEKSGTNGFAAERSFEKPYLKKTRLSASVDMSAEEAAFHNTMKPSFASNGLLIYSVNGSTKQVSEPLATALPPLISEHKEVRFAAWVTPADVNTRTLSGQKEMTSIESVDDFPRANTSAAISFIDYATISADDHERAIWNLAGHLFDPVERLLDVSDMSEEHVAKFEPRLRKDAFSSLWSSLIQTNDGLGEQQLAQARSAAEQALFHLTRNDVAAACDALAAGKDFKLATLVAQLPGSEQSRQLIQGQITAWRDRNDWAEFPTATRALYSILAGEVCVVAGRNGTAENRAKEFCIAEEFGLSWLQSLGLRIFFGGHEKMADAVKAYCSALADGSERVLPLPSWTTTTACEHVADREDVLMGLLRLSTSRPAEFNPASVFDSTTVSGSAVNSRLAWQLATQLRAKGLCSALPDEKLDQLTFSFAMELEAAGKFITATWVLLHLRHAATRTRAVSALLFRNGGNIPEAGATPEGTVDVFHILHTDHLIPSELLWAAKAQHARAELDNAWLQCEYLLQAGALDEAHGVVCETLGPRAIIEQDYGQLKNLVERFPQEPAGWAQGGGVFADFARLVTMNQGKKYSREGAGLMSRLRAGLEGMRDAEGKKMRLEERVAMVEMGRVLQREIEELAIRPGGMEVESVDVGMGDGPVEVGIGGFLRYREAMGVVA